MVQIFQEALLTGCDGADLLRQVEVEPSAEDPSKLTLTAEYTKLVEKSHEELLRRAEQLSDEMTQDKKIIFTDDN
jgi:hypothetical protein